MEYADLEEFGFLRKECKCSQYKQPANPAKPCGSEAEPEARHSGLPLTLRLLASKSINIVPPWSGSQSSQTLNLAPLHNSESGQELCGAFEAEFCRCGSRESAVNASNRLAATIGMAKTKSTRMLW